MTNAMTASIEDMARAIAAATIMTEREAANLIRSVRAKSQHAAGRAWSDVVTLDLPPLPDALRWSEHGYCRAAPEPMALMILTQPEHGACVAYVNSDGFVYPCRTVSFSPWYDETVRAWIDDAKAQPWPVIDLRGIPATSNR